MKYFLYEGERYLIDDSRKVSSVGDLDENQKIVFVDFQVPEDFHEGIAVHEIEERKLVKKGHSYEFSHNEAQKKEDAFYIKKFGKAKGGKYLREEEKIVLEIFGRYLVEEMRELKTIKEEVMPVVQDKNIIPAMKGKID